MEKSYGKGMDKKGMEKKGMDKKRMEKSFRKGMEKKGVDKKGMEKKGMEKAFRKEMERPFRKGMEKPSANRTPRQFLLFRTQGVLIISRTVLEPGLYFLVLRLPHLLRRSAIETDK